MLQQKETENDKKYDNVMQIQAEYNPIYKLNFKLIGLFNHTAAPQVQYSENDLGFS